MNSILALALFTAGWAPQPTSPPPTAEPARQAAASALEIESPGALGARYGIGVDVLFESLDELDLVSGGRSFSFRGPAGGGGFDEDVPIDPDSGLRWEQTTVGLQVPISLPPLSLGRGGRVDWSLVLEAAGVDGELELEEPRDVARFLDRIPSQVFDDIGEGPRRTNLQGRGTRFGVGFQATVNPCRACSWTWSGGYRYRTLQGFDLEQEAAPHPSFRSLLEEDGELQRDDHELTARLGYALAGGRLTPWLGVRGQRSETTVDHAQTFIRENSDFPDEREELRLEVESERVSALVGADFRLARGVVGRVEGTFGDGESVLLKVVTFPRLRGAPSDVDPPPTRVETPQEIALADDVAPRVDPPPPTVETPQEIADQRRRADELADDVAPRVDALRQRFRERVRQLERAAGPGRPLDRRAVRALVGEVEAELRSILAAPELQPALAAFVEVAERSRRTLGERQAAGAGVGRQGGPQSLGGYRLAAYSPAPQPPEPARSDPSPGVLAEIGGFLDRLFELTDERRLTQPLCVRSVPEPRARVALSAALPGSRVVEQTTEGRLNVVYRGLYAYRATLRDRSPIACTADSDPDDCAFVDLWTSDDPFVVCDFSPGVERCLQQPGDPETCGR